MFLKNLIDWSEVWAPLIPLLLWLRNKPTASALKPIALYFFAALILNTIADIIWQQKSLGLSLSTDNNNPFYNLHSIIRLVLLSIFFIKTTEDYAKSFKHILLFAFFVFTILDFYFWENFWARRLANSLHSAEAVILLVYCLLYYLFLLRNEASDFIHTPSFWIVTGLILFVVVSFPIYLFYERLIKGDEIFTFNIWKVQKIGFICFCILTAIGFSMSKYQN